MDTRKYKAMHASFTGHDGPVTVAAVQSHIPPELYDRLAGRDLGLVMSAVNAAYHAGRKSTGAEVVDADARGIAVWVDKAQRILEWSAK